MICASNRFQHNHNTLYYYYYIIEIIYLSIKQLMIHQTRMKHERPARLVESGSLLAVPTPIGKRREIMCVSKLTLKLLFKLKTI